jgi:hypothetical protein
MSHEGSGFWSGARSVEVGNTMTICRFLALRGSFVDDREDFPPLKVFFFSPKIENPRWIQAKRSE